MQRFRCRHCHVVITVVPDDVVPRRHYRASAIALALLLFGVLTRPIREVRARVCPWRILGHAATRRWLTLRRWLAAIAAGTLFACVRAAPAAWSTAQLAARAAMTLEALAPIELVGREVRVTVGAVHAR